MRVLFIAATNTSSSCGSSGSDPARRRTRAAPTRGLNGLSVGGVARPRSPRRSRGWPPRRRSRCRRRARGCPSGPGRAAEAVRRDRRHERDRRDPLRGVEQVLQHDSGAHAPADQVHPGRARARRPGRRGRRPSRARRGVASIGSGSVSPYPRRSTASARCRPVAASASSGCCQNSDELTLPCTNRTASPGPAGSTPSGCSTDWVNRLVAHRRRGDAGQQDVGHGGSSGWDAAAQASDGVALGDTARAPPRLAGEPDVVGPPTYSRGRWPARSLTSHPPGAEEERPPAAAPPRSARPAARRRPAVAGAAGRRRRRRKKGWDAEALVAGAARGRRRPGRGRLGQREQGSSRRCPDTARSPDLSMTADRGAGGERRDDRRRSRTTAGCPSAPIVIALATAQQESRLRNLDYGDRDSLGLFQQRPSAGLGHARRRCRTRCTPPDKFYDHLVGVPGWETGGSPRSPDSVQRSAFPEAYRQWEAMAAKLGGRARSPSCPTRSRCTRPTSPAADRVGRRPPEGSVPAERLSEAPPSRRPTA